MLRVSGGEQRQPVDGAPEVFREFFLRERPARLVEDQLGFGADERGGRRVIAHHAEIEFRVEGFAFPPEQEFQPAAVCRPLGLLNCDRHAFSGVVGEGLSIDAQDDIVHQDFAISRRFGPDMRDQDLPAGGGGSSLLALEEVGGAGVNPTAQTGGAEIVGQFSVNLGGERQVGRSDRRFGGSRGSCEHHDRGKE